MKKTFKYIMNSRVLLIAATVSLALFGCEGDDLRDYASPTSSGNVLSVVPSIFKGSVVTRADGDVPAVDELKENELTNLDVFVIDKATNADAIYKQWHLVAPTDKLESTVKSLLENDWRKFKNDTDKGLVAGRSYDVYVAANNEKTQATVATLTELKALYVNDTETNGDKTYPTIQKTYKEGASSTEHSAFVSDKKFAMDGKITGWQVVPSSDSQTFEVDLKRAAAKILVNVSFDQNFLDMQKYRYDTKKYEEDGTIVWVDADGNPIAEGAAKVEKDVEEQETLTGAPAWRYVNFFDSAPVFTDGTLPEGVGSKIFRQTMYFGSLGEVSPENSNFLITTYSYPCSWTKAVAINDAPFIMLSLAFRKGPETSGETNYYYYRIPVTDETKIESLDRNKIYIVNATINSFGSAGNNIEEDVDLNYEVMDWTEDAADNSNVLGKPLDFLLVTPKIFNIYSDADGNAQVEITAYAPNGKKVFVKDRTYTWVDATGAIRTDKTTQTVPTEATNGKIIVTSKEMANHAVKTIKFTAYLEGHETDLYHEVVIKHFPVDNIQQFTGSWSSKIGTIPAYQFRSYQGSGYNTLSEISKSSPGYGYTKTSARISQYDYYILRNEGYDVGYSWGYYYINDYWVTYGQLVNMQWIDWDNDQQIHNTRKGYQDKNFRAKMYNSDDGLIYPIYEDASGNNWIARRTTEVPFSMRGLTNNHMYVVQISSTSDEYVLGTPILGNPSASQSQDHVVSPAFMIASQLGAVSTFDNGKDAADHCRAYMEVGTDGVKYTGWRLPTAEEIAVIADRQNDPTFNPDVIVEVLGGDYYYNLSGGRTFVKGKDSQSTNTYARCVRDLNEADLKRLNGE